MTRRYWVVDAFSAQPLMGNPVAVILDAEGLSDAQMQSIARWTNLSETTFVLPATTAQADYRLRIFTPASELAFAGHPTLGSAKAIVEAGLKVPRNGKLVQQCKAGLIEIDVDTASSTFVLQLPEPAFTELSPDTKQALADAYDVRLSDHPFMAVDVGIVWGVAEVESVQALMSLNQNLNAAATIERDNHLTGVSLFACYPDGNIEVRSFAVCDGVPEDPVCGSGNGAVAAYRRHTAQIGAADWVYSARQGRSIGRDGHIRLSADSVGTIRVGGQCVVTAKGELNL